MTDGQKRCLGILATFAGTGIAWLLVLTAAIDRWGESRAVGLSGIAWIVFASAFLAWSCGSTRYRPVGATLFGLTIMLPLVGGVLDGRYYAATGMFVSLMFVVFGAAWPDYPPPSRREASSIP